ncbi:MAG: lysophospholipid acyltransferase family protein [Vampirovibrionales bacterium]|nr:lysophospholipid acyltransferase family protein [Vampirovibrionales bacterium]
MSEAQAAPAKAYSTLLPSQLGWREKTVNRITSILLWLWLKLRYGVRVVGQENIPSYQNGIQGLIAVANHTSNWDPPLMSMALLPLPVSYMAKQELFKNRFLAAYFALTGAFAVNRAKLETATIRSAKTVVQHGGWALGMFPEGTRVKAENGMPAAPQQLKRGAAFMARLTKADVLPLGFARREGPGRPAYAVSIGAPVRTSLLDEEAQIMEAIQVGIETQMQIAQNLL